MQLSHSHTLFKLLIILAAISRDTCFIHNGAPVLRDYLQKSVRVEAKPLGFIQHSLFPDIPPFIRFAEVTAERPRLSLPREIGKSLTWRRSSLIFEGGFIVHQILNTTGIVTLPNSANFTDRPWFGYWHEYVTTRITPNSILTHPAQKMNLFKAYEEVDFKDRQGANLQRLIRKHGRALFPFHFETYVLPEEMADFEVAWERTENKFWVLKPPKGFASIGVRLIENPNQVPVGAPSVVQKYLHNLYLIRKRRVELRMYVLLTSVHPFRIYVYGDGVTKIGQRDFSLSSENMDDPCVHTRAPDPGACRLDDAKGEDELHLENYLWKNSKTFEKLTENGVDIDELVRKIRDAIVKTFISAQAPMLEALRGNMPSHYNSYHLWDLDFLLDSQAQPWLIEVNALPSLNIIFEWDVELKFPMLTEALNIVGFHFPPWLSEAGRKVLRNTFEEAGKAPPAQLTLNEDLYKFGFDEPESPDDTYNRTCECALQHRLDNLGSQDVKVLKIVEDELSRVKNFVRVFPGPNMAEYLSLIEFNPRVYCLLSAWEAKYGRGKSRKAAIVRLLKY